MPKTIHAVYENGVFRPTEPVDLPDPCEVEFEPRQRTNGGVPTQPGPRVGWDDIFATKLVIGSAPPDQDEDVVEVTGDDFLF